MVPWWLLIIAVFLGGWGGYALGQKVYDKGEEAIMLAKGYVKDGEDWVKAHL